MYKDKNARLARNALEITLLNWSVSLKKTHKNKKKRLDSTVQERKENNVTSGRTQFRGSCNSSQYFWIKERVSKGRTEHSNRTQKDIWILKENL